MSDAVSDFDHYMQHHQVEGIQKLRRLRIALDQTVLSAFAWPDLDLAHTFVQVETLLESDRIRFTITPAACKELLKRLLAENHKRAVISASDTVTARRSRSDQNGMKETSRQGQLIL